MNVDNLPPNMTMRIDIHPSELPDEPDINHDYLFPDEGGKSWRFHNIQIGTPLFKLFEAHYDAVFITTVEGIILAGNARAATFFKTGCGDLVGKNVYNLIAGATDDLSTVIKSNLDKRQFTLVEGFCNRFDGTTFASEVVVNRLDMDVNAQLIFFIRDITVRHEAHQKLEHAMERLQAHDRARMEFVSNVSHELRTPLTSMIYAVTNMLRGVAGPMSSKIEHYLERLQSDCHRLMTTVNDILDLSQIESEKLVLARKTVPLRSVIGSGAETLRVQADAKRIKLNFNFGYREIFASCDLHKMQRVIMNLVGNAVKFTPEDGTIDVSLSVDPENETLALIKVSDTGMGVPKELLPKLSQRYFRIGELVRGSGLGLAISREIIELHEGTIAFASPVPGTECGTEVSIRLPMADSPKLVLLSDDADMEALLERRVSESGYSLQSMDSARKVIMCFRSEKPGALMIDRRLKDVDVQELILYFRDAPETKRTSIILMDYSPLMPFEVQLFRKLSVFFVQLPLSGRMLENTLASAVTGESSI